MIKIIIVAVVIWALVKIFAPPKKKGGNSGSGTQPNQNQSAMKQAAKDRGVSKREIYQILKK